MHAISASLYMYAEGGAVGIIDDTSDWSYFLAFDTFDTFDASFFGLAYFYFFVGDLEALFDPSFYLLFDFTDFYDFSPSAFFLLLESLLFESPFMLGCAVFKYY